MSSMTGVSAWIGMFLLVIMIVASADCARANALTDAAAEASAYSRIRCSVVGPKLGFPFRSDGLSSMAFLRMGRENIFIRYGGQESFRTQAQYDLHQWARSLLKGVSVFVAKSDCIQNPTLPLKA
jgi:hypothetical protein